MTFGDRNSVFNKASVFATILILATSAILAMTAPAAAQDSSSGTSSSVEANTQVNTSYKSFYEVEAPQINTPVTVGLQYHLYRAGEEVAVQGSVWTELVERVESIKLVKIDVKDGGGNIVAREDATIEGNGEYATKFKLLDSANPGTYTVEVRIEIEADALGLVNAITSATLRSSMQFVVAIPSEHPLSVEGENFAVQIASNSGISDLQLKQQEKMISFFVEGDAGTTGVTEIKIPKKLLSGEVTVLMDQNIMLEQDVLLKSDTDAETTLEINYKHSIHRVEVAGTNVVPEFPVTGVVVAVAIASVIASLAVMKRMGGRTVPF